MDWMFCSYQAFPSSEICRTVQKARASMLSIYNIFRGKKYKTKGNLFVSPCMLNSSEWVTWWGENCTNPCRLHVTEYSDQSVVKKVWKKKYNENNRNLGQKINQDWQSLYSLSLCLCVCKHQQLNTPLIYNKPSLHTCINYEKKNENMMGMSELLMR